MLHHVLVIALLSSATRLTTGGEADKSERYLPSTPPTPSAQPTTHSSQSYFSSTSLELNSLEATLLSLFASTPDAYVSPSVELFHSNLSGGRIGVRSSEGLAADEVLAVIPAALLIGDVAGSTTCDFAGIDIWKETLSEGGNAWFPALCLFIIRYGTRPQSCVGDQGEMEAGNDGQLNFGFGSWLDLLPAFVPNAAYYGDNTAKYSGYRPFFEQGQGLMTDVQHFLRKVSEVCGLLGHDSLHACLSVSKSLNIEQGLRWAISMVMSRGFGLTDNGAEFSSSGRHEEEILPTPFLAPFDFWNHNTKPNVRYPFDSKSESLIFSTKRSVAAGEELFISYGLLSSNDLAAQYGFVPLGGVLHDVLEVAFAPDPDDPNADLKSRILSDSLGFHRGAIRRDMHISSETMAALRLCTMAPEEMSGYTVSKVLSGHSISQENDQESIWLLHDACVAYERTLAGSPLPPQGHTPQDDALRVVLQYREVLLVIARDCVRRLALSWSKW